MQQYPFKRWFYYDVKKAVSESSVTFLLGPRHCGKTVCLRQLHDAFLSDSTFDEVIYVDAKKDFDSSLDKSLFLDKLCKDIECNAKKLYLVDETTYLHQPDCAIADVQYAFTALHNTYTKVVFTGSQSRALDFWGHIAFAGDAVFVRTDFLSYPEWLAFKQINEISEEIYEQYIRGTREFYHNFHGTKEYLQGCLEETAISNLRSEMLILDNCCEVLSADKLLDVLYASLISSHNQERYETFFYRNQLHDIIARYFPESLEKIGEDVLDARIAKYLAERYRNYQKMQASELKQALKFLNNCGLISITFVSDNFDVGAYVVYDFLNNQEIAAKPEVLQHLNISIKYPMFYVDLLESLLGDKFPQKLPRALLGDIVENHVRGILPNSGCFEYRDAQGREIDYIRDGIQQAVEISIENKDLSATHFDVLPEGYEKILLTKDQDCVDSQGILRIPYYKYIFNNSVGKDMVASHLAEDTQYFT